MTDIELPPEPPKRDDVLRAQASMDDTYRYLAEMADVFIAEVKAEWDKLRTDGGDIRKVNKLLSSELMTLLRLAKQTEGSLNEIRNDRAGRAGEYAIDFGEARAEIGRRLDRIRATKDTVGLS